jgi:hypothetical protein
MRTPPAQYQGAFPERIRVELVNGDRGTLHEAYIRDGVLYGWGWQEGAGSGQRFGFALSEVERIELPGSDYTVAFAVVALFGGWCVGTLLADQPCFWPINDD